MKRKGNGEGTIFQRPNGKWTAQAYVTLTDGTHKRISVTDADRQKVLAKLLEAQMQERKAIPFANKVWTVNMWLDHWLADILPSRVRRITIIDYEKEVRLHIKPYLGKIKLEKLSVRDVQVMIDKMSAAGVGIRTIHKARQALSAALGCAMRQELIFRNVARLVDLPKYSPKEKQLWTVEETQKFMNVAKDHQWYFAYVLIFTYGMRRGEALGLRWSDVDFKREVFCIRQQILTVDNKLQALPVKTKDSQRDLPLTPHVKAVLLEMAQTNGIDLSENAPELTYTIENLITKSEVGTPVAPRNFNRALDMLAKRAGVPRITPHVSRHMGATFNKDIGTPLKDVQQILGHAHSDVTQKIYQHGTPGIQRQALTAIDELLYANKEKLHPVLHPHHIPAIQNESISELANLLPFGSASRIRTCDLRLRRPDQLPVRHCLASVIQSLQTVTNRQLLGAIASENCIRIHRGIKVYRLCKELGRVYNQGEPA